MLLRTTSLVLPLDSAALPLFGLLGRDACTSTAQHSSRNRFAPGSSAYAEWRLHVPDVRDNAEPAPRFRRSQAGETRRLSARSLRRVPQRPWPDEAGREAFRTTPARAVLGFQTRCVATSALLAAPLLM